MSEDTRDTTMSAEESRLDMRSRFDAANDASASKRQIRYDADAIKDAEKNKGRAKQEVAPDGTGETAENDSPGG
jgi:hypothetical protein